MWPRAWRDLYNDCRVVERLGRAPCLLRLLWVRCQMRCAIVTVAVVALPLLCRSGARRLKISERCIPGLPLDWLGAVAVFVQPLAIMQD